MGNPFAHLELSTDDVAGAKKFYKKLFDWKITDMAGPGSPYTMIDCGDETAGGGIQAKPMPGMPTAWLAYVEVESVQKTLAKAEKAGAKIIAPFRSIGEMGAVGVFVDPNGAALGVWERAPRKAEKKAEEKPAKKPAKKAEKAAKKAEKKPAKKELKATKKDAKATKKDAKATKKDAKKAAKTA